MSGLIDNLRSFNSKERFFLIGKVLGNPDFRLSTAFKNNLGNKLELDIPDSAFAAMDYHLDWLYASLYLTFNGEPHGVHPNKNKIIRAQQEDVDFIIAFDSGGTYHIILIEAKGVTGWTNRQLDSKAKRFGQFFGVEGTNWRGVIPHFLLMSPRRPSHDVHFSGWPAWMHSNGQVNWLELKIPQDLYKVTRCDAKGRNDRNGKYWKRQKRVYIEIDS